MLVRNFGHLPFVYRPLDCPTNGHFPDSLPFVFRQDEKTGLAIQTPNPEVEEVLQRAYSECSMISGMMDKQGIGRQYADDFLSYIKRQLKREQLDGLDILDIGCGTGYLLYLLKQHGAKVVGLEPGAHGQDGAKEYGIQIIRDFFPSTQLIEKYDVVMAFGVLEHVQLYRSFLNDIQIQLKNDGVMLFAVPDCQPYLSSGDISFLFHEHWNYFTAETMRSILCHVTGLTVEVERAAFGGSIYAAVHNTPAAHDDLGGFETSQELFLQFLKRADVAYHVFLSHLKEVTAKGQSLGIYVPGRALNILALVESKSYLRGLRFFDDNEALQGTYYPGFNVVIESRRSLMDSPPDELLIMSHTFGDKIRDELRQIGLKSTLTTWHDILS